MFEFVTADALSALLQVILIDLVLAGDNAVVIGLAAAGLPAEQRAAPSSSASLPPPACASSLPALQPSFCR